MRFKRLQRQYLSHHFSMPRFTSNVLTSYHTYVCTLCLESILSRFPPGYPYPSQQPCSPHSNTDTLDPNCYRPISILPCIAKVFESQVNKQITDHLESHRTFSTMQSGFRAGHGCTSATLKVLNDIITTIDKRLLCNRIHRSVQGFRLCQSPHPHRQTRQPWFLK